MLDAMLDYPAASALGAIGLVCGVLWPVFRSRSRMLWLHVAGAVCWTLHYAFMGAMSGAASNAVMLLQAAAAIPLGLHPRFRLVYLASLPILVAVVAWTWAGWPSAFAAIGAGLVSLGRYQLDVLRFRAAILAALPFWFGHNLLVMSVPAMAADVVCAATSGWMLWRTWREGRAPARA
ncbi:MAG: YgjV family protein [Alphaproteobacteria bacterium]|nr:YgjV family protein [Alphaproteobacteria bacterium]